jgi:sulfite exporter TauE/SafE
MHEHGHFEHLLHTIDVFDVGAMLAVTWFSFVMSWHCGVMCGPLVCAKLARPNNARQQTWFATTLYNLGRMLSYVGAGAAVGLLSGTFAERLSLMLPQAGVAVTVLFASILIAQGWFLLMNREVTWAPKILTTAISRLLAKISRVQSWGVFGFLVFGMVTALLPCMTLASALAAAAMTGSGADGAMVMLGFVLGTLPVMMFVPVFAADVSSWVSARIPVRAVRRVAGSFLILAAGMTMLRLWV